MPSALMGTESPFLTAAADREGSPGAWPLRQRLVAFSFVGSLIAFTDRVNISIAPVSMRAQFGGAETQFGWALSAFFIGYVPFLFVSGLLARRFGGRRVAGPSCATNPADGFARRESGGAFGDPRTYGVTFDWRY